MASIVLAEDDSTMVGLLSTLLRMDGYEVTAVDGDSDVLHTVEDVNPDALLLDMLFAQHNGLELVERIRRSNVGEKLYIIMMSGLSVREDCLRRGADDFLQKPFMPDELTRLLRAHIPATA